MSQSPQTNNEDRNLAVFFGQMAFHLHVIGASHGLWTKLSAIPVAIEVVQGLGDLVN